VLGTIKRQGISSWLKALLENLHRWVRRRQEQLVAVDDGDEDEEDDEEEEEEG
jgi:hypothetical protein